MSLERKLVAWEQAGLIDSATAERIRAHEADAGRPILLWAVAALGLFAVVLGIILIISANWDRIPGWLKLGVHWLLLAGALATVWDGWKRQRLWQQEGALFLAGGLVMAGIALHAQVYQLVGPLWEAGLSWLLVMTPAMLLLGRTRLTGTGWALVLMGTLVAMALDQRGVGVADHLLQGLAIASPAALLLLAGQPRLHSASFAKALRDTAIPALLAAASIAHFGWASHIDGAEAGEWAVRFLPAIAMAVAAWFGSRNSALVPPPVLAAILFGATAAGLLTLAVPHPESWVSRLVGVIVYMAMWGAIARAAAITGWNRLFGVAIGAIAVRIFIIYIELFGSLAATGLGLVAGGVLLVLLALGWRRMLAGRRLW